MTGTRLMIIKTRLYTTIEGYIIFAPFHSLDIGTDKDINWIGLN